MQRHMLGIPDSHSDLQGNAKLDFNTAGTSVFQVLHLSIDWAVIGHDDELSQAYKLLCFVNARLE